MKQNWQYKKLGEVATFINGYPFKPLDWKDYGKPIIRIQNLNNPDASYNFYDGSIEDKYIISKGDILISWSGSLGVYEWEKENDAFLNQHIFKVKFDKIIISKQFFKYAASSQINEMKNKAHGITMQHITKGEFEKTLIPVPPLSEQERIVAELDLLSGIIEKQKQQLKELDTFAQSIFYSMFGDPISNEKSWQKEVFNKICKLSAGGDKPNDTTKFPTESNIYPIFSNSIENEGLYGYTSIPKIKEPSITIAGRGVMVGTPFIRKKPFFPIIRLIVATPIQKFNITFLYFLIRALKLEGNGGAIPQLTVPMISNLNLIFPPLSLQNEFAEKIEKIEQQKEAINKSIEETQKLFDYTMDKYFG